MSNHMTCPLGCLLIAAMAAVALVPSFGLSAEPDKPQPEKIEWGKEVNGLVVAIAPAKDGQGRFLVRWKNVGKETLELPWVRFGSDQVYKNLDDLWHHVSLTRAGGNPVPARQYRFPLIGGPPYRPRTVILEPDKIHEETIDLWTYVDKPAEEGRYQLSIELEIRAGFAPSRKDVKYWTGKIQSNVLEVKLTPNEQGRTEPPGVPLEAHLEVKKDTYTLDLGGKSPEEFRKLLEPFGPLPPAPKVDLVLELRNTGDKPISIWVGTLELELKGPGAVMVTPRAIAQPSDQGFPSKPQEVKLEPSKSYSIPITSLDNGNVYKPQRAYWTEAGEYTLAVRYQTAVSPVPERAKEIRAGFGSVVLISAPVKLKVEKSK